MKGYTMETNISMDTCWGTLGSVRPFPNFRPEKDIADIQSACQQKDVTTLVRIMTNRDNAQRQSLAQNYLSTTSKELTADLKRALSGDLESLMLDLLLTPDQFDAQRLHRAMKGLGTDEETLLEVLCTRSPPQLKGITSAYNKMYQKDLEKDLEGDTSGDFTKLLLALIKKENGTGTVDQDVNCLSEELNGEKADATPWISLLTTRCPDHLRKVLTSLEGAIGQPVDEALEKRFGGLMSGDLKLGLTTLVHCIQNPATYLAKRLQSMKGGVVQGVLVSHCEEDLLIVRVAYLRETGTSLYSALQSQFKGDFQNALLALCRAED
ncbi:annexin A2 [Clupea harengus]|uniref:Annexin n=1 Tax=Clupea harengus TaxID=7950 RepID=A0A6P8H463_CLUHA|nr:annexin A2 [Clupea harengus]